jgi:hypothetical protein
MRTLHGEGELAAGLAGRAGGQAGVDPRVGHSEGRQPQLAAFTAARCRPDRLHVVQPDEAGSRVAQSLTVEAEGLAGLLLVEALELAGFSGEDGGEFGEAVPVSRVVAATPGLAAYCT